MLYRILKKDLKRRKGVNLILFLFIILASVFLASSVNNILVVSNAVEYFMDYANVPDVNFITAGTQETDQITDWLEEDSKYTEAYGYNMLYVLTDKNIKIKNGGKQKSYDAKGTSIYLGTTDADYGKVFDQEGNSFQLNPGEIAMSQSAMDKGHLKLGDNITIQTENVKKNLKLKLSVKDAIFGNDMAGMCRFIISREDFEDFSKDEGLAETGIFYVTTSDEEAFQKELNQENFSSKQVTVTKSMYQMIYAFDMLLAALLILIGICLILIALLVLRFTLVFTIEEEYREIGIMKAQGYRNFGIKKIYLVKYFAIVTIGALLGLAASIPVSRWMVQGVSKNMIMADGSENIAVNVICSFFVIALVMVFCYLSTRKLNKVSAITAIRGGHTGERFRKRTGMRLCKRKSMGVCIFLGLNDLASHVRRYMVLMITFCLSFVLITIPLNTVNTMKSDEMVRKFGLDPESSVYVRRIEGKGEETYRNVKDFENGMERVKAELKEAGYDASLSSVIFYFLPYGKDKDNIMTLQMTGAKKEFLEYSEGEAPKLDNEIAFSKQAMERNGWVIGDTIEMSLNTGKKKLVISGTYSDYMQLGLSARINSGVDLSSEMIADCWNSMVHMNTEKTQKEWVKELKEKFPDYEWSDAQMVVDSNVGGIRKALNDMLLPMTAMLCAVIMLITALMEKLFVIREKGEIAMMKSIGFRNRDIRKWQIMRMVFVVLASMAAAIPLSLLSNQFILRPIFAIMGAELKIQVVPWQVYGVYPCILLVGIITATIIAAGGVKRIDIRELNNLE